MVQCPIGRASDSSSFGKLSEAMPGTGKKLRFRFGLKWFLLIGPLLAAFVGLYIKRVKDRNDVLKSLATIAPNATRSLVEYDYQFDEQGKIIPNAQSSIPTALLNALGPTTFHDIVGISLDGERITISDAAFLTSLKNLKRLDVEDNSLSGQTLEAISRLHRLERLDLQKTGITDEELRWLEPLSQLRWLSLSGSQITDSGLAHLRYAVRLESLSVKFSSVTGSGLRHLECSDTLRSLVLHDSPISDASVDLILRFKKLERLDLTGSEVNLSNESLSRLAELKRLSELLLRQDVREDTLSTLKDALPNCKFTTR
jgi:Leucine-rich repeat (LRR) protein